MPSASHSHPTGEVTSNHARARGRSCRRHLESHPAVGLHKVPYGGEGPARTQQIVATSGWKWSVAVERHGIPIGWTIDGANRHDTRLLEPRRGSTTKHVTQPITLQLRWIVEALNSWWRTTATTTQHRPQADPPAAALCLATTVLIIGNLLNDRNGWSPT